MKDMDELNELKKKRLGGVSPVAGKPAAENRSRPAPASGMRVTVEHTVGGGDTLSHIALKYYGSATKPYWMVIYEANKALIGDNPNRLKRGITLRIPELPAVLEK